MTGITLYPGIRFQTKFSNMHYIPRFPRNSYGKSTIKEYTADRRWAQRLLIFNEIVSMGKIVPANFPTFITLFSYSKRVSPGAKSMSRTQSRKKYARSRTASVWASLRPMHARGPVPNIGRSNSDTPSHLDGLNWPGFSKVFGFRPNWNVCWEEIMEETGPMTHKYWSNQRWRNCPLEVQLRAGKVERPWSGSPQPRYEEWKEDQLEVFSRTGINYSSKHTKQAIGFLETGLYIRQYIRIGNILELVKSYKLS